MMNEYAEDLIEIGSRLRPGLDYLARRQMLLPGLLLLSSHAPLAFVTGQMLWLLSPFELLIPNTHLQDWARILSHPQGGALLKNQVENILADDTNQRGDGRNEPL